MIVLNHTKKDFLRKREITSRFEGITLSHLSLAIWELFLKSMRFSKGKNMKQKLRLQEIQLDLILASQKIVQRQNNQLYQGLVVIKDQHRSQWNQKRIKNQWKG